MYQMNPLAMCLISEAETSIDYGILQGLSCLRIPLGFNQWESLKGDPRVGRRGLQSPLSPCHHPTRSLILEMSAAALGPSCRGL